MEKEAGKEWGASNLLPYHCSFPTAPFFFFFFLQQSHSYDMNARKNDRMRRLKRNGEGSDRPVVTLEGLLFLPLPLASSSLVRTPAPPNTHAHPPQHKHAHTHTSTRTFRSRNTRLHDTPHRIMQDDLTVMFFLLLLALKRGGNASMKKT